MMSPTLKSEGDMSPCPPPIDAHGYRTSEGTKQSTQGLPFNAGLQQGLWEGLWVPIAVSGV